jgi:hypothetical protein
MDKAKFLSRRWNDIITLVQGVPTVAYMIYGLATPLGGTQKGMIILSVSGALFWIFLEYHTSARFARLQKKADPDAKKTSPSGLASIILLVHSILFWSFLIPFFTPMSYRAGFVMYTVILLIHLAANTYINLRISTPAKYYAFPLRIPWGRARTYNVLFDKIPDEKKGCPWCHNLLKRTGTAPSGRSTARTSTYLSWHASDHTYTHVQVTAMGAGAAALRGINDNVLVFEVMLGFLGVEK